jgi:hypothetical protein
MNLNHNAGLSKKERINGSSKLQLAVLPQNRGHKVRGYQEIFFLDSLITQ